MVGKTKFVYTSSMFVRVSEVQICSTTRSSMYTFKYVCMHNRHDLLCYWVMIFLVKKDLNERDTVRCGENHYLHF
jgi:hypothetical protein